MSDTKVVRVQKYVVKIERITEISIETEKNKQEWRLTSKENGREVYGWAENPSIKELFEKKETLTILEQELDDINVELVIRAINFPKDFGFVTEQKKVPSE